MRRTYTARIACTVASIGLSFAQIIKTDTMNALAVEWRDTTNAVHCLNALRLYTMYTKDPEGAAKTALQELVAGDKGHAELFEVAQGQPDFLNWLATAHAKEYKAPDDVFKTAADVITQKIYKTGHIKALSAVHKSSQAQHYALALSQLLDTYCDGLISVDDMQTLRACYDSDAKQLFKIVDEMFTASKP